MALKRINKELSDLGRVTAPACCLSRSMTRREKSDDSLFSVYV